MVEGDGEVERRVKVRGEEGEGKTERKVNVRWRGG